MCKLQKPYFSIYMDKTICRRISDLTRDQTKLCYAEPDTTLAAMRGLQMAVKECQHQFKNHRWNCSSLVTKEKYPYTSPFFNNGFRETAFAYAITSAGVAISVARECSQGSLLNCGCDAKKYKNEEHKHPQLKASNWKWSGCSHNIHYGIKFARMFLDRREKVQDIQSKVNLQNNKVGRLMVKNKMQIKCKCHGMSGGCEFKTCWRVVPDIRIVGISLKEKYDSAVLFSFDNRGPKKLNMKFSNRKQKSEKKRVRSSDKIKKPFNQNLIYYQRSPSYCEKEKHVDILGTTGRFCNRSSTGVDNCSTLCCGRGYDLVRKIDTVSCNCRFEWCCKVE